MRIVEICTAESLGGLELYFATCCRELKKRGHDLTAVVFPDSKLHQLLKEEVSCIVVKGGSLKNFGMVKKVVRSLKPDAVHVHHKKDLLLGALLRRFSSHKFNYLHTRQMDLPRKKKNPYHTFLYSSIDLIIAITDRLKDQIIERINVNPTKVVKLYYGVPQSTPNPQRCAELGIDAESFNLGVIARIDHKKEQHVVVEASRILKASGKKIGTYLIGGSTDDTYLNYLEDEIKHRNLEDVVAMVGFMNDPQELMTCFDTIVLTTGNETFGLVLPEAMRMGVAVIGANGGGVPEIIDHEETGLMFTPGNAGDLAKQIEKMMNPDTRKKLAAQGKDLADQKFEIGRHFDNLENLMV